LIISYKIYIIKNISKHSQAMRFRQEKNNKGRILAVCLNRSNKNRCQSLPAISNFQENLTINKYDLNTKHRRGSAKFVKFYQ